MVCEMYTVYYLGKPLRIATDFIVSYQISMKFCFTQCTFEYCTYKLNLAPLTLTHSSFLIPSFLPSSIQIDKWFTD